MKDGDIHQLDNGHDQHGNHHNPQHETMAEMAQRKVGDNVVLDYHPEEAMTSGLVSTMHPSIGCKRGRYCMASYS